jgi:transcriptional regulator with XRE-family HTH domain
MKSFGDFLANLRSSTGISQAELAVIVDSSKSTISRLENDDIPRPFRGSVRKLILALAEILCSSKKETERYLELAGIDRSLLTEADEIQLGFPPNIVIGSPEEVTDLERLICIYEQHLHRLARVVESGISSVMPILKRKIQAYSNILQEMHLRLDKLQNKHKFIEPRTVQPLQGYEVAELEGRFIVGYQYGKDIHTVSSSGGLFSLASPNARWLMELANVDYFAVDDSIILTNSHNFAGWEPHEIKTTVLNVSLPIPEDLADLRQEKLPEVEKKFFNSSHYRLAAYTPMLTDRTHLEITLAPLSFYDYYSLTPFLDEPLLTALDGTKVSPRQKYGNTALTYSSSAYGACLIPAPVSIQGIVITKDHYILLMQRSPYVALYPNHWSASFEEAMNAPGITRKDKPSPSDDGDIFTGTLRGLHEEFAIPADAVESIKILSLTVEYLVLAVGVMAIVKVDMTAEEIKQNWALEARDKDEASSMAVLSTELTNVVDKLFSDLLWHPTARMRLLQFLFHTYGVDAVKKAIKDRG